MPDMAMDALLYQNFTRDRHSGDSLRSMAALLGRVPPFRRSFGDVAEAAECLEEAFSDWHDSHPETKVGPGRRFRLARFGCGQRPGVGPQVIVGQRAGTEAEKIGGVLYLADAEGLAIHRKDGVAAVIWDLLQHPAPPAEIVDILSDAFPGAGWDRIAGDRADLTANLAAKGLIMPKSGA